MLMKSWKMEILNTGNILQYYIKLFSKYICILMKPISEMEQ